MDSRSVSGIGLDFLVVGSVVVPVLALASTPAGRPLDIVMGAMVVVLVWVVTCKVFR